MALYLIRRNMHPEQVQDFIPLPLTLSGAMYHTGRHPFTGQSVYVAKTFRERKMQRALIQYRNPSNRSLIRDALDILNARHLAPLFFKAAAGRRGKEKAGAFSPVDPRPVRRPPRRTGKTKSRRRRSR